MGAWSLSHWTTRDVPATGNLIKDTGPELATSYFAPGETEIRASQVALVVKNLPASAGDVRGAGSLPKLGGSPAESHGQWSLVGYSPWSRSQTQLKRISIHTLMFTKVLKPKEIVKSNTPVPVLIYQACFHCRHKRLACPPHITEHKQ